VEKVETAIDESFQDHFVEALGIPHAKHEYPNLAKVITLPESSLRDVKPGRKRRARIKKFKT
jgi:uncharacterized 2Fe-2S/4Fe-4S cluster protein (DUF4445 family)